MDIYRFWEDVLKQDANAIREYFEKDAYINWHVQMSFYCR